MKKVLLFSLCASLMVLSACVKPGKGGKAILSVHVFEGICDGSNRIVVPQAMIYIKYGGTEVDHTVSGYDDAQQADFGGKTVFENLKRKDSRYKTEKLARREGRGWRWRGGGCVISLLAFYRLHLCTVVGIIKLKYEF